jgi:thioesterase domain-containing protein
MTLLRAIDHLPTESQRDRYLGWNGLAVGGIDVRDLPGYHLLLLSEPFVQSTARELLACLERSRSATRR